MYGIVYILKNNKEHRNIFKIGKTSRNINERISELTSSTSNLGKFVDCGHVVVSNIDEVEKRVHIELNDYRVQSNREFFECPINLINEIIKKESKPYLIQNKLIEGYGDYSFEGINEFEKQKSNLIEKSKKENLKKAQQQIALFDSKIIKFISDINHYKPFNDHRIKISSSGVREIVDDKILYASCSIKVYGSLDLLFKTKTSSIRKKTLIQCDELIEHLKSNNNSGNYDYLISGYKPLKDSLSNEDIANQINLLLEKISTYEISYKKYDCHEENEEKLLELESILSKDIAMVQNLKNVSLLGMNIILNEYKFIIFSKYIQNNGGWQDASFARMTGCPSLYFKNEQSLCAVNSFVKPIKINWDSFNQSNSTNNELEAIKKNYYVFHNFTSELQLIDSEYNFFKSIRDLGFETIHFHKELHGIIEE